MQHVCGSVGSSVCWRHCDSVCKSTVAPTLGANIAKYLKERKQANLAEACRKTPTTSTYNCDGDDYHSL
eukprot:2266856-Amphidinium_carterae.1